MKKNIIIKKLNFSYNKTKIFDDFSMNIYDVNTTIIGTPASGKTTLARILAGLYVTDSVSIHRQKLIEKNIVSIRQKLAVVLNDFYFVAETVEDELAFGMENICVDLKEMRNRIDEVSILFELTNIINHDPNVINNEKKALIKILSSVLMQPKTIVIDGLMQYLPKTDKLKLYKFLKEKEIQIINITTDIEEALLTDYLIVLDKGKIILEGKVKSVLTEEKILKRLGFNLPFMVDLSKQLIAYGLIDKIYYNEEKLVGELWK